MENTILTTISLSNKQFNLDSKKGDEAIIDAIATYILEDSNQPVETVVRLKRFVSKLEKVITHTQAKEAVITELDRRGVSSIKTLGVTVEHTTTKTDYNFDACGHPLYNQVVKMIEELNNVKKAIQEELKLMVKNKTFTKTELIPHLFAELALEAYGEVVDIEAPVVNKSMGLKFTGV